MILVPILTGIAAAAFAVTWWLLCRRLDNAVRSLSDLTPLDLDF